MEIKIGIQHSPRELTFESNDTPENVEKAVTDAVHNGSTLSLTDSKGRRVLVSGERIAYVEIGGGVAGQVGFRS